MRGKYSPTVTAAYMKDQGWFRNFMDPHGFIYDPEGFDSYGYNEDAAKDKKASDDSWITNPDRMGGAYAEDELKDRGWK